MDERSDDDGARASGNLRGGRGGGLFAGLAALVALVWLVGLALPAYRPLAEPVAARLPTDPDVWSVRGPASRARFGDGVTLLGSADEKPTRLHAPLPLVRPSDRFVRLRLSGWGTEEPTAATERGSAALGLRFVDAAGKGRYRNVRFAPSRHRDAPFVTVLDWPVERPTAEWVLVSRRAAPSLTITDARAELVRPDPRYKVALGAIATATLLWLAALWRFLRGRRALGAVALPAALLVALGVAVSSSTLAPLVAPLAHAITDAADVERSAVLKAIYKGGHALGFALLTVALWSARGRLGITRLGATGVALLIAVGSEGVQTHLPARGASLSDVLIDVAGITLAVLAVTLAEGWRARSAASATPPPSATVRLAPGQETGPPDEGGEGRDGRRRP